MSSEVIDVFSKAFSKLDRRHYSEAKGGLAGKGRLRRMSQVRIELRGNYYGVVPKLRDEDGRCRSNTDERCTRASLARGSERKEDEFDGLGERLNAWAGGEDCDGKEREPSKRKSPGA